MGCEFAVEEEETVKAQISSLKVMAEERGAQAAPSNGQPRSRRRESKPTRHEAAAWISKTLTRRCPREQRQCKTSTGTQNRRAPRETTWGVVTRAANPEVGHDVPGQGACRVNLAFQEKSMVKKASN
ncbi:hypothetical protein SELMODRAFT_414119 [Selaginella moellendorffii]|uniref:Uncharacterized protein n=1 Tax=Selaginella moellendorffii TaxID=88036 RepID=D8RRP9_SELML|nr:hypothetical protein SELMODRAFT_414119 [Selaginella moellendorffii]